MRRISVAAQGVKSQNFASARFLYVAVSLLAVLARIASIFYVKKDARSLAIKLVGCVHRESSRINIELKHCHKCLGLILLIDIFLDQYLGSFC